MEISERTVRKYIKELEIKAQYVNPYTVTTEDSDFSSKLENILMSNLILLGQMQYDAQIFIYLLTDADFVYLISIMDLYSRKIII